MSSKRRVASLPYLKEDLYLIVEGEADAIFINKIISFLDTKYNVRVRNANGNGNIPIQVNILRKIYSYSKVLVLYDLDGKFNLLDIKRFLKNKEVVLKDSDIYFVNPSLEFLLVLTKEITKEKFVNKKEYKELIFNNFAINDYAGHIPQIEKIVEQLTYNDFQNFLENLTMVSKKDSDLPATNLLHFINRIKN